MEQFFFSWTLENCFNCIYLEQYENTTISTHLDRLLTEIFLQICLFIFVVIIFSCSILVSEFCAQSLFSQIKCLITGQFIGHTTKWRMLIIGHYLFFSSKWFLLTSLEPIRVLISQKCTNSALKFEKYFCLWRNCKMTAVSHCRLCISPWME